IWANWATINGQPSLSRARNSAPQLSDDDGDAAPETDAADNVLNLKSTRFGRCNRCGRACLELVVRGEETYLSAPVGLADKIAQRPGFLCVDGEVADDHRPQIGGNERLQHGAG